MDIPEGLSRAIGEIAKPPMPEDIWLMTYETLKYTAPHLHNIVWGNKNGHLTACWWSEWDGETYGAFMVDEKDEDDPAMMLDTLKRQAQLTLNALHRPVDAV